MLIRVSILALGLAIVLGSAAGSAQETDKARAKSAFQEGKQAYGDGKYTEAAAAFRRAYEIMPTWKVLYNIAQCEALAKRHGLAFEAFQQYLSQGGDDISTERRDEVMAEIDRLKRVVGSVEIAAPDGATVLIDGTDRGETPLPGRLKVAAGVKHTVRVELGGEVLVERSVLVSSGETMTVEAKKVEPSEPSDEESDTSGASDESPDGSDASDLSSDESDDSAVGTWGWVTLGLGGALLIGGGITGGMALGLDNDLSDPCSDGGCPPSKHEDLDKRDTLATTSSVLLGVGAAAAVAGVLMLTLDGGDEDEAAVDVGLAPSAGSGFAGAAVTGRF